MTSARKSVSRRSTDSKSSKSKKQAAKKASSKQAATKKSAAKKSASKSRTAKSAKKSTSKAARKRSAPPDPSIEIDADVLEFIDAIDAYKQQHSRPFPSWSEVLFVLRELGYRKPRG
ncbi:MAG: hypothetical protein KDB80_07690 [Planctomycetes bacterium]|nr:hypothetical protein [Planctomycetota bacterium]